MNDLAYIAIRIPVLIDREDEDCFTAYIPDHVATQGRTRVEALENIAVAVKLYLDFDWGDHNERCSD